MRSSHDTSITILDTYDMYTGIGSGRLGRLLFSYGFRFSVSTWNIFGIAVRDSDLY
jgi:hypothetical protein